MFLVVVFVGYSEIFSDYDSRGVQLCFYIIENPPEGSPLNMEDTKKTPRQVFSSGTRYIATKCDFAPMTDDDDVILMTSR